MVVYSLIDRLMYPQTLSHLEDRVWPSPPEELYIGLIPEENCFQEGHWNHRSRENPRMLVKLLILPIFP